MWDESKQIRTRIVTKRLKLTSETWSYVADGVYRKRSLEDRRADLSFNAEILNCK